MKILVFGDSVTQGYHDDLAGGWCNRLAQYAISETVRSNKAYSSSVFNLGISGNNTEDLVKRFANEVRARLEQKEGAILFALGVNDSQYELATGENKVSLSKYRQNLEYCINEAKQYTEKIYINTLLPVDDTLLNPMPWKITHGYKMEYVDLYNEVVRSVATDNECVLIEVADVLPNTTSQYLFDGIHPNAEGHQLIFERVKEALEKEGIL